MANAELARRGYELKKTNIESAAERARRALAEKYRTAGEQQETNFESRGILRSGEAQMGRGRLASAQTAEETDLASGVTADLAAAELDYLNELARLQAGSGGAGGGGGGGGGSAPSAPSAPPAPTAPGAPPATPSSSAPSVTTRPPGLVGSADVMERRIQNPPAPTTSPATTNYGSADTLERRAESSYKTGEFVGGPNRRTANGGAVVDGIYIAPGTFGGGSTTTNVTRDAVPYKPAPPKPAPPKPPVTGGPGTIMNALLYGKTPKGAVKAGKL